MTHHNRRSCRRRTTLFVSALCLSSLATAWWGCSAEKDGGGSFEETGPSGSAQSGAGGSAGGSGSGGSGDGGSDLQVDGGSDVQSDSTCVAEEAETEFKKLDIVILLDKSGSMGGSNWTGSTNAIKAFVGDPASDGISVGIVYFPIDDPPGGDDCNYLDYQQLVVPIAELPMNAQPMVDSLDATTPSGGTPMHGALQGALFAATAHQDANPDHKVILVFASDGEPAGCDIQSIPQIAELAQKALNYNGVETYVIAIAGANLSSLNQIAIAGGTGSAYDVTANVQAFSEKMAEIRAAALPCEFAIPPPPRNEELDPSLVNVNYTAGGIGDPQKVPKADNKQDCGSGAGWYYDDAEDPTMIILCPASCQTIQADPKAKVDVAFGCKSDLN